MTEELGNLLTWTIKTSAVQLKLSWYGQEIQRNEGLIESQD